MDGFGPIHREADEPVFHELWESRVFGMFLSGAGLPPTRFDSDRHRLEQLAPIQYFSSDYYERWLAALETGLLQTGTLSQDEIEARVQQFASDPDLPIPRREDPEKAQGFADALRMGKPATRKIRQKPHFAVGDKILTRNLNPRGHTRLPRYARGKRGIVVAHHGAHVFPDTNAHGLGENPQHLYTVRITMYELWGSSAERNESVLIDLWESYLERDRATAKAATRRTASAARKTVAKTLPSAGKVRTHATVLKGSLVARHLPVTLASTGAGNTKKGGATQGRGSARSGRKPMRRNRPTAQ